MRTGGTKTGVVTGRVPGYLVIKTGPGVTDVDYIPPAYGKGAEPGDTVTLTYHSSSSYGLWSVTEVTKA